MYEIDVITAHQVHALYCICGGASEADVAFAQHIAEVQNRNKFFADAKDHESPKEG